MLEHADDCINYTERQLEKHVQWRTHAARAAAAEELSDYFLRLAANAFKLKKDHMAAAFRGTAELLGTWAKNERKLESLTRAEYDTEYPA
jgi:hypothetical protein